MTLGYSFVIVIVCSVVFVSINNIKFGFMSFRRHEGSLARCSQGGGMTGDVALQMVAQLLWTGVQIAAPILLSTLFVGLVVSIFQVATQIQEVSLSFIPKIITVVLVLVLVGPWMLKKLVNYSASVISSIPSFL